jgi:hypothetical protein
MPDTPPIGQRFSHIYLQRGEPTQDSARMRRRLAALVVTFPDLTDFHHVVPRKLGVDVPWRGTQPDWAGFFSDCALTDVLDFVTAAWRHFAEKSRTED